MKSTLNTCIVIPNLNGVESLADCLDSLLAQTHQANIIIIENDSTDGSAAWLAENYPDITVLVQDRNLGFAGGVNVGIEYAIEHDYQAVALFNNDAVASQTWLEELVANLQSDPSSGIVTGTFMSIDKQTLDSTGDIYTTWGLPYPRGRGEPASQAYDDSLPIFGASGGASLYRVDMLKQIGLFDEDFFAYYEDVDISFRAQLAGWKVRYVSTAVAYHQIGQTSSKIKGFTTRQTIKNYPWLLAKNLPGKYLPTVLPRFLLAYTLFVGRAVLRGHIRFAAAGLFASLKLLLKKLKERRHIQATQTVTDDYIWSIMTHDLPPNAHNLRQLRAKYWKLTGKS